MAIGNQPSSLPSPRASAGTTSPEAGYLFVGSGEPYDVAYLGKLSISASTDGGAIVAADPNRLEYGAVPLSAIGTAANFTIAVPLSSAANTAVLNNNSMRIAMRTAGASALIFFVKDAAGNSLSATLPLGVVI